MGLAALESEAGHPLSVVVVYDEPHRRDRAMEIYNHVLRRLTEDFEFETAWFKASHLRDEEVSQDAAARAREADVVVFSIQPALELTPELRHWIHGWTASRKANLGGALVLLMEEAGASSLHATPARFELALAARQAGMDFLCESVGSVAGNPHLTPDLLSQQASRMTPVLTGILDHRVAAPVCGGLNE